MDEPTSALDPVVAARTMDLLDGYLNGRDTALILITHDLGLAAQHVARLLVMEAGQIGHPKNADRKIALCAPKLVGFTLLKVEEICVKRGKAQTLSDVSLTLPAGRTLAVVGESGAGKSTLIAAVLGLLKLAQGRITSSRHARATRGL